MAAIISTAKAIKINRPKPKFVSSPMFSSTGAAVVSSEGPGVSSTVVGD